MHIHESAAARRVRESSQRPSGKLPPQGAVSLAMGEPDFPTPAVIREAMNEALARGVTTYGDLNGDHELRFLLAERHLDAQADVNPSRVSITHGASAGISATILATVDPGDRVVIPEPTYSLYQDLVQLAGGIPVYVPLQPDHQLDVDAVAAAARRARLVILCNPGNPTGAVLSPESLEQLGCQLRWHDVLVIADEAYSGILHTSRFTSALDVSALADRVVLVQTFSKTYAMTGWRLGYTIAPEPVARRISLVHRTVNGAVNSAVQRAGVAALRHADADAAAMANDYTARRYDVLARLAAIEGISVTRPDGAFYAFIRHGLALPSSEVVAHLAGHGVIIRSGTEYGPSGEGHIRISYAASRANIEEGIRRIESGLRQLRAAQSQPRSTRPSSFTS